MLVLEPLKPPVSFDSVLAHKGCHFHKKFKYFRQCNGHHIFYKYVELIAFYLVFSSLASYTITIISGKCFILYFFKNALANKKGSTIT